MHDHPPAAQITLISRQNSGRKRVTRRIGNEPELLEALASISGTQTQLVDLATLSLQDQIELIVSTDLLIGALWVKCTIFLAHLAAATLLC